MSRRCRAVACGCERVQVAVVGAWWFRAVVGRPRGQGMRYESAAVPFSDPEGRGRPPKPREASVWVASQARVFAGASGIRGVHDVAEGACQWMWNGEWVGRGTVSMLLNVMGIVLHTWSSNRARGRCRVVAGGCKRVQVAVAGAGRFRVVVSGPRRSWEG